MNNEPVAWMSPDGKVSDTEGKLFYIPLYTHPVKDREKDRLKFSDEAFNRWLDEGISDSGHTVYDLVENVCEAWHGWENSQYYTHPVKEQGNPVAWRSQSTDGYWSVYQSPVEGAEPLYTGFRELTDEEILKVYDEYVMYPISRNGSICDFARMILRKAQE